MPCVFRAQFVFALAIGGIALLALPATSLGQSASSDYRYGTAQQTAFPDVVDDSDQFAQAPPTPAPVAPGLVPPSAPPSNAPPNPPAATTPVPNGSVPNPNTVAQGPAASMPNLASMNGATQPFSLASTPNMFGDLGGGYGGYRAVLLKSGGLGVGETSGTVPIAGGDQFSKISEDCSPLPTDRVFFDFNGFNSAALTIDGRVIPVNRYTFGFEKTFFDGAASIELRAPVVGGLRANESDPSPPDGNEGTVFGDLSITGKYLWAKSDTWASSVGLMVDLPTAPNASVTIDDTVTSIKNESLHLQPFVGLLLAPNDRLFSISYLQLDFDANGSPVTTGFVGDPDVLFDGRLRDPTLMHVDISLGYWWYDHRAESRNLWGLGGYVSGIAPVVELHYTTSLQDFSQHVNTISPEFLREDILDLTLGLCFQLGPMSTLNVAAAAPLRTAAQDREFDSELIVQFDRHF